MKELKASLRNSFPAITNFFKKLTAKTWPENSIVFYTGKHREGLSPKHLSQGASGAHIAVIYLAKTWAAAGRKVAVYTHCPGEEGIYDGVEYIPYYNLNWQDKFDTLIIWKNPKLLPNQTIQAKQIWFDWHDVVYPPEAFTDEVLARYSKIFVKSRYQRQLLPQLPDDKFFIATNGVDESIQTWKNQPKNPYKLIYASRYYRGLESMLEHGWPVIKEQIPEAELHIFYGWTRRDEHSARQDWKQKMLKLMEQPGVIDHGKVSQEQLILEKSTSAIHYYGCTYEEIDCISVRESAMVGCVPVTTDFAALQEKSYCVRVPGDPLLPSTQVTLAEKIVELIQNPEQLAEVRNQVQELSKSETWQNIAPLWLKNQESLN